MKKILSIFSVIVVTIMLSSCNEAPTDIGLSFISDTVSVKTISSDDMQFITKHSIRKMHSSYINMGGFLIGKADDYQSMTFIRFETLKDTFKFIKPEKIISSTVKLKVQRYAFGDSLAPLAFDVYKNKKLWFPSTPWDSVFKDPADYIDYSKKIGEFNQVVPLTDSGVIIKLDLDKELISEWLFWGDKHEEYVNTGIAFVPNANSRNIRKFEGPSLNQGGANKFYTEVFVKFYNSKNEVDSVVMKSAMEYTLSDAPEHADKEDIVLQGAVQYRTDMEFDFSSLPDNIAIHSAYLELKLNKEKSRFSNYNTDSLRDNQIIIAYRGMDLKDTLSAIEQKLNANGTKDKDFVTYKFPRFTYLLEQWILHGGKKGIATLHKAPIHHEHFTIDKYVFYGMNDPNPANRPRLRIVYSKRPDYNYQKGGKK